MKVTILVGGVHADLQALDHARFGHRALLASNVYTQTELAVWIETVPKVAYFVVLWCRWPAAKVLLFGCTPSA